MYSSVPGRALVTARTATPGTARLHALVVSKSEDILHIAVADRPAWRCRLAGNARTTIDLPLGSVADGAPIAIEHGVALEIEELRISWPAAGAASGPCAAEASRPR